MVSTTCCAMIKIYHQENFSLLFNRLNGVLHHSSRLSYSFSLEHSGTISANKFHSFQLHLRQLVVIQQ
ncbi:hypothetical protein CBR65_06285 [Cellvibrio sp. PSBB006]|nr:hypothetical protein CBR65_06285 [Cellvibrio sp. PSBB006]